MHIHFVQHETFEAPGAYLRWAQQHQYTITFSRVYASEPLPDAVSDIDVLIVMGGPQSPDTTDCPHFNAAAEIRLIQKCIAAGKAVIGVCLGSQLIGEALQAPYHHNPEKEIGNFPIYLTAAGMQDKNIHHFGPSLTVGHWHNDMPGLTADAIILATSKGCPRQIVKYADRVYGFQCHMELTREVVELLIASEPQLAVLSQQYTYVHPPADILAYDYTQMNNDLYQFLDKLTSDIV